MWADLCHTIAFTILLAILMHYIIPTYAFYLGMMVSMFSGSKCYGLMVAAQLGTCHYTKKCGWNISLTGEPSLQSPFAAWHDIATSRRLGHSLHVTLGLRFHKSLQSRTRRWPLTFSDFGTHGSHRFSEYTHYRLFSPASTSLSTFPSMEHVQQFAQLTPAILPAHALGHVPCSRRPPQLTGRLSFPSPCCGAPL